MQTPIEMWQKIKAEYPDTIIMIRVGDFQEVYGDDATTCSKILGLKTATMHSKGQSLPIAGFPHQSVDAKLAALIKAGQRVALAEWKPYGIPQNSVIA